MIEGKRPEFFTLILSSILMNRFAIFVGFFVLCILGIISAQNLPIDAVPDITNVQVVINTKTKALDPGKIEKLVTYPIETEVSGVPGVEEVRSLSKYGLSQIVVVFRDRTDIYFARQLVSERLQNVRSSLPEGLTPQLAPVTTGLGEVLMYSLSAREKTPLAAMPEKQRLLKLREMQEYIVRPTLRRIQGVADVDTSGGLLKQIHINVFPGRLEKYGFSLEKFISKIESMGESFGGGYIQNAGQQIIVRASGELGSLETIAQLPLAMNIRGQPIRIRDVAEVSVDHALRLGAATSQGHEIVLGTVLMAIGGNSREVSQAAEKALRDEIKLPDNVELKVLYSRSHLVNATIRTIIGNLSEGAILVVLVLLLLLGNLRAALIVACAIPISMLCALKGMELAGISANLMSLGAIDFGLLVDGAVVLIENVLRRLKEGRGSGISKMQIIIDASHEVLRPVGFGLLIIMLVYMPILYLDGIESKMFKPMAITVLLALGASLFIALLLMPALASVFLPDVMTEKREPWLFRVLQKFYARALGWSLSHRWVVWPLVLVPGVLAVILSLQLGSDFIPELDEGDLVINLARDTRQDIDASVRWQKRAENIIAQFGEVDLVFSRMGTPESALDPMGPYLADTFVILKKDRNQWPLLNGQRRTKQNLYEAIRARLASDNPNQEISATQPIEMRFNEMLEGSRADVSLRIFGPDLDRLLEYSDKAKEILAGVRGVAALESDPLTALKRSPVLEVVLNYEKMARFGISLTGVNSVLEASMSGKEVGSFYEGDRRFPVILHLDESLRNQVQEISKVPIALDTGGTIPMSSVTDIKQSDVVTTVARSSSRRYSALSIFLKDRDIAGFVAEAKQKIQANLKVSPGYDLVWGGQFKNLEKARSRLNVIVPMTLFLIFLLLLKNFGNLRHALLVFSAIPFAMVGGVFSLYLRAINFSISTAVGFIALAGIAILNSIVMVSFFDAIKSEGQSAKETAFKGAMLRLRPVAMTALVASLGFLPMAFNTGPGAEVQRPLATVVMGGLISSTLLILIVVPVIYSWIEERYS